MANQISHGQTGAAFWVFLPGSAVLICLRIVLKLDFIDPQTGFYRSGNLLSPAFHIVYLLCLALLLFCVYSARPRENVLPPLRRAAPFAALLGLAIPGKEFLNGEHLIARLAAGDRPHRVDLFLSVSTLLVALAAAATLLVLAANQLRGRLESYPQSLSLTLTVLYQCMALIIRFTSHTSPLAVSDDLLEIALLIFGVLFFMAHARVLTRLDARRGAQLMEFSGYALTTTALVLFVPELFGLMIGRLSTSSEQGIELFYQAALMLYSFVFTRIVCSQAPLEPPVEEETA